MKQRHFLLPRFFGIALVLVLALAAFNLVTAQDTTTTQTDQKAFLGVAVVVHDAGAKVTNVAPGSGADEAGVKIGDIITALNGEAVTAETLADLVQAQSAGDEVQLTIMRGDETLELTAVLGEVQTSTFTGRPFMFRDSRAYLGVTLNNTDNGVEITEVAADSPAAAAGLEVGDIILAIGDETVSAVSDVAHAVMMLNPGDTVSLNIKRGDSEMQIEATLDSREVFDLPTVRGFGLTFDGENWMLNNVPEDSPLYEAGLRSGDILTAVDGETFDPAQAQNALQDKGPEATVTVTVTRDGETLDIDVPVSALGMMAGDLRFEFGDQRPFDFAMPFMGGSARLGVTFVTLDEQTAAEHDVTVTEGALITEVAPDSPANEAGLQVGDIITAVDGDTVDEERTLRDRLFAYEPGDTVTLDILRGGEEMALEVTLGQVAMPSEMMPFFGHNGQPFRFFSPDKAPFGMFDFGPGGHFEFRDPHARPRGFEYRFGQPDPVEPAAPVQPNL